MAGIAECPASHTLASDHSAKSSIHFTIEQDVEPWINGTVSLTEPRGKVDGCRMPFYSCRHHVVHLEHLHGQLTDCKNQHNDDERSEDFFLGNLIICQVSRNFVLTRKFVEPYFSRDFNVQVGNDGERQDIVDDK